jgi:hypothetical protein
MMPAPAHVAATFSTERAPPSSAFTSPEFANPRRKGSRPRSKPYESSAESRCRKLVAKATTVAQNTESSGEKPNSMKITMEKSERKWNQYFFVRLQADSTRSKTTSFMPNLRTSISTMRKRAK